MKSNEKEKQQTSESISYTNTLPSIDKEMERSDADLIRCVKLRGCAGGRMVA